MTRLNITLPDEIAGKLADKHNKSRFIAMALKEKFEQERQKEMANNLIEGYNAVSKDDKKLNADWDKISLEKWN